MAESYLQLAPDSSGKKAHTFARTIGANVVEDEVVLLGENYLAGYTVYPGGTGVTATANSHLLQIMAGASLKVRIRRIEIYQTTAATTATLWNAGVYRLTTAGTGGTASTPSPLDPSDAASGATAMSLPTVKGTEGVIIAYAAAILLQTVGASTIMQQPLVIWDFDRPRSKPLIIAAGAANGIAVKNLVAVAGADTRTVVWLDESNY